MSFHPDETTLSGLFHAAYGAHPNSITALKPHASDRRIYRLLGSGSSIIGVVNDNRPENLAFVYLAKHFRSLGLSVPEVLRFSLDERAYLLDDLGDTTLRDQLDIARGETNEPFPHKIEALYKLALTDLVRFQVEGGRTIDFSQCYPESSFSTAALKQDLLGFSSELVLRILPSYPIESLTADYRKLSDLIAQAPAGFFLYRDFQSRNIMVQDERLFFIDFQGGRKGPLQYDVVSLLYQSSATIPQHNRDVLLDFYLCELTKAVPSVPSNFKELYGAFIIARMLQVLGVYGRQGLGAGKEYFRESIPLALQTLSGYLGSPECSVSLPTLLECIDRLGVVN